MSPEKEKRLIAAAEAYEAAVRKVEELKEKRDKLRASEQQVQAQLGAAERDAMQCQTAMFEVATSDVPALPSLPRIEKQLDITTLRDLVTQNGPISIGSPIAIGNPLRRMGP